MAVPMLASDYLFRAILIPFLIFSLAAIGVNILVGYCGQISLGSGAFMAVGAYGAYNFFVRIPGMPLIPALILGGLCATVLRHSVRSAQPARQGAVSGGGDAGRAVFCRLDVPAHQVVHQQLASGSVSVSNLQVLGPADRERHQQVLASACRILVVVSVLAKNLVRGAIGREWMAIRDMDVAAAVIGIRPMYAKLSAFAVSSFIIGMAGALWAFVYLGAWEPAAFSVDQSFRLLFMVIIGGHGLDHGRLLWRGLHHCDSADRAEPVHCRPCSVTLFGHGDFHGRCLARRTDDLRRADRVVPDRRAAWPGQAVVHRQTKTSPLALPPLISRVLSLW